MYDIFYLSQNESDDSQFLKIKTRYPRAIKLSSIDKLEDISCIAFTKMFWVIWDDFLIHDDFNLNLEIPEYDQKYIHVWKNGKFFDGLALFPKSRKISLKEFACRFYIADKKEIDIMASIPRPFDIVFLSYDEKNADENYQILKQRFPRIKRIHGVKGIHNAHIEAAKIADTEMFFVVDADASILDDFRFEIDQIPFYNRDLRKTVYVWKSKNSVNGLEYGYGGVKLLPKTLVLQMDQSKPDMTTSISRYFQPMPEISNITVFDIDSFSTWRSAFRECVKLSSKSVERQIDDETENRLKTWCTVAEGPFAKYSLDGAVAGKLYGEKFKNDIDALKLINDFDWLKEFYESGKYRKN